MRSIYQSPLATGAPVVSRLQELPRGPHIPWVRAAALYVAVRVVVLGVLVLAAQVADRDVLRVLTGWDAGWYAGIADRGYGTVVQHPDGRLLSDYAFFPLFPVAERVFRVATGSDFAMAGLVVAVLSSVVAAVGIYRVGELLKGERAGLLLVLLWAVLPVGAVQWMSYSESLFTALAAWSLYFVLTERWAARRLAVPAGRPDPADRRRRWWPRSSSRPRSTCAGRRATRGTARRRSCWRRSACSATCCSSPPAPTTCSATSR